MTSYDEVPYPLYSHSQTHPAELATLARLHSLSPAPIEHCRVLEIGCAGGGNIIPMAYGLPGSEFLGIDYSPRQIEQGQQLAGALKLKNVRLVTLDLMDFDPAGMGLFDYVIAHGFYSWVPGPVREKLMEVCQRHLAPQGIAYISFNAYPGWKGMSAIRDMLLYRTRDMAEPDQRAGQAHHFLDFLAEFTASAQRVSTSITYAHAEYLKTVLNTTKKGDEAYFLHDILEETNDPVYFHEFAAQAGRYGLQYLTDSDFRASLPNILPPPVAETLNTMARSRVDWEQYCDFLSNRMFRQSLLCRQELPVNLKVDLDVLRTFRLGSMARPEGQVDPGQVAVQKFVAPDGASLSTDHPVSKAALHILSGLWPQTAAFDDLFEQARRTPGIATREPASQQADLDALAGNLLKAFSLSSRLVSLTVHEPVFCPKVSERPVASEWARLQSRHTNQVTTLRHMRYALEPHERFVLERLDGDHDRPSIVSALLAGPVAEGELTFQHEGQPVSDPAHIQTLIGREVEKTLRTFALAPLLTG
jgi:methyltransferase-like protein/SAM-dependent methyltransferase